MNEKEYLEYKQRHVNASEKPCLKLRFVKSFYKNVSEHNSIQDPGIIFDAQIEKLNGNKYKIVNMWASIPTNLYKGVGKNTEIINKDDKEYEFLELKESLIKKSNDFFWEDIEENFASPIEDILKDETFGWGLMNDKQEKALDKAVQSEMDYLYEWHIKEDFKMLISTSKYLKNFAKGYIFELEILKITFDGSCINKNIIEVFDYDNNSYDNKIETDYIEITQENNHVYESIKHTFDKLTDEYCLEQAKEFYLNDELQNYSNHFETEKDKLNLDKLHEYHIDSLNNLLDSLINNSLSNDDEENNKLDKAQISFIKTR